MKAAPPWGRFHTDIMSIEDKAQEHEAKMWELANAPRPTKPTFKPGDALYGPEECDGCGAHMPDNRRVDGCRLCTSCQTDAERLMARHGR